MAKGDRARWRRLRARPPRCRSADCSRCRLRSWVRPKAALPSARRACVRIPARAVRARAAARARLAAEARARRARSWKRCSTPERGLGLGNEPTIRAMLRPVMVRRLPVLQNQDTDDAAAARRPRWQWVLIGAGFVITLFLPLSWIGVRVSSLAHPRASARRQRYCSNRPRRRASCVVFSDRLRGCWRARGPLRRQSQSARGRALGLARRAPGLGARGTGRRLEPVAGRGRLAGRVADTGRGRGIRGRAAHPGAPCLAELSVAFRAGGPVRRPGLVFAEDERPR